VRKLRIGSRGSKLALWQAQHIQQKLREAAGSTGSAAESEIVIVRTSGDAMPEAPIAAVGTKGVFIKELEDELLAGRIDLAVHSMKDVPTELPGGLIIAAIAKRADPRDCLLSRDGLGLAALPSGAKVGTSSLRRQCQLKRYRGDLEIRDVRGNVDTRIRKMEAGEFDAIVLAKAGIDRLGLASRITETLEPAVMLSAVGQGAMGVEIRADDAETANLVRGLDDSDTHRAVEAERSLLQRLEGGCQVPLGALASIESGRLTLDAAVFSADGGESVRRKISGLAEEAESLGKRLAEELLKAGAEAILTSLTRGYSA
jgi:hydroxymethylbilane synthase